MSSERVRGRDGEELAILMYDWQADPGIEFVTGPESTLQVGCMLREKGYVVPPHEHKVCYREIVSTPEVLFVRSGSVLLELYERGDLTIPTWTRRLKPGDVAILLRGGHGVTFLEESVIQEVRQGPYLGKENDKDFGGAPPRVV